MPKILKYYTFIRYECKGLLVLSKEGPKKVKERILSTRPVRWLTGTRISRALRAHPFFSRFWNYEMIMYIICGVLTTVVNYVVYFLMPRFGENGVDIILAQVVAWIAAVLFAFFTNKIFVFESPDFHVKVLFKELIPFVAARLISLGFDTLFVYVTVAVLGLNEPLFKLLSNIFVLIANYLASKFIIFKKKDPEQ